MSTYQAAEILANTSIGDHVRHLVIKPQSPMPFEAGQFFLVRLRDEAGELVERSYSVANFSSGDLIEFVVRIEPQGHMSQIVNNLQPGATMDIKGPFGRFGYGSLPADINRLVLIAGGVGISPLRSILQKSFQLNEAYPTQLFYGFRNPEDFLFQQEFEGYAKSGRLEIISAISDGKKFPGWESRAGYVMDFFEGHIFPPEPGTHSLICGPPPMVKSSREKLFSLGFPRNQVHVEAW